MKYLLILCAVLTGCATQPQTGNALPPQYTSAGLTKLAIKDYIVWAPAPMKVCRDGNKVWSCK